MDGYNFYKIWAPINLHFTNASYDISKYHAKSKSINIDSYNAKPNRTLYEKWGNKFSSTKKVGQFCIANSVYNSSDWLYQAFEQANEIFIKWKSKVDSLSYHLKNDYDVLSKIMETKGLTSESLFVKTPKGNKPPLLQLFLTGHISKEFIVAIDSHYLFLDKWGVQYEIDPLVSDQIFVLKKYKFFVMSDNIKELIKEIKLK